MAYNTVDKSSVNTRQQSEPLTTEQPSLPQHKVSLCCYRFHGS